MDIHLTVARKIRRLKWVAYALGFSTVVLIGAYLAAHSSQPSDILAPGAIALLVSALIIEIVFWEINRLSRQLNRQLEEKQSSAQQQNALLNLFTRLAATRKEEEIYRLVSQELQTQLGQVQVSWKANNGFNPYPPGVPAPQPLNIPVRRNGKSFGMLTVMCPAGQTLSSEAIALVNSVANLAAVAIENARLLQDLSSQQADAALRQDELRSREQYLTLLNYITRIALHSQDFTGTLQSLTEHLRRLYNAENCLLALREETQNRLISPMSSGTLSAALLDWAGKPAAVKVANALCESGGVLSIESLIETPQPEFQLLAEVGVLSLLVFPLVADGHKLGLAMMAFQTQRKFSQRELSYGEQATSQIALALSKMHALNLAQHKAKELDALQNATAAMLTTLDLENLLGQILEAAMSANPIAEKGVLHLMESGELRARAVSGDALPPVDGQTADPASSYIAQAVRERKPLLINDVPGANLLAPPRSIASLIIAPLLFSDDVLGVIELGSYHRQAFNQADLRLLVSFAATATAAIHNAQLHAEVQKQAITDTLTGLYNRRGLVDIGQREVLRAHRFKRPMAVMMIDIDHFKQINDQYGHLVGDQILAAVSSQCMQELRQLDLLGRYGGDEMVALLPETDLERAMRVAERLHKRIGEMSFATTGGRLRMTVSVGVATLGPEDSLKTLIDRSDQALYKAKEAGRNKIAVAG